LEAAVTDATTPAGWYSDFQIPNILRWWDGHTWTSHMAPVKASVASPPVAPRMPTRVKRSPARIPELVVGLAPDPGPGGGRQEDDETLEDDFTQLLQAFVETETEERDVLRGERTDLEGQLPPLRRERDRLRVELAELHDQLSPLRRERDELLAAVTPLKAEVAELRSQRQEGRTLRSELQALQSQKSSLDRKLADLRRPVVETGRGPRARGQRFHDS
jgi:FtsZ-binding cell division protein ZapB